MSRDKAVKRRPSSVRWAWVPLVAFWAAACSSDAVQPADGGAVGAGSGGAGRTGTGGTASGGASPGDGGTPGSGGRSGGGGVATGGAPSTGGKASGGVPAASGGAPSGGAATSGGTAGASGGTAASGGGTATAACDGAGLVWKTGRKTNYTSYPDPGSEECVEYNGCTWAGQFAACNGKKPESWVASHDIAAAFPDFGTLELHDLCLRSGAKTMIVTVLDTCGDSDCSGCCTRNKGSADQLIDLESYTNERWGLPDGAIEWADLGPTKTSGCN